MKNSVNWKILAEFPIESKTWYEYLEFISKGLLSEFKGDISLNVVGKVPESILDPFDKCLKTFLPKLNIRISKKLKEGLERDNPIFLIKNGITTQNYILEINKKMKLQKKGIFGVFVFK